ncbi:MAG: NAD(P)-dependent oxidoreductase, partial [Phyllobacterium sp.]
AQPVAEHAVALVLAAAKRLVPKHTKMARGEFDQNSSNRLLAGGICGVLGYGGIGRATAQIMRAMGMTIHAISRSGRPDGEAEFVGSLRDIDRVLSMSDVLVIALPLSDATRGLIGERELALMKRDAILINVSRAHIVREDDLYWHLKANPEFWAGLDPWWIEPMTHGLFRLDYPFFDLPNVVGSPHNSGNVPGIFSILARSAAENIRRFLAGEPGVRLVHPADRLSKAAS